MIFPEHRNNVLSCIYSSVEVKYKVEKRMSSYQKVLKTYIIGSEEQYDSKIKEESWYVTVL